MGGSAVAGSGGSAAGGSHQRPQFHYLEIRPRESLAIAIWKELDADRLRRPGIRRRERVPRHACRNRPEQVRANATRAAADTVTMPDKCANLQRGKAVKVGANAGRHALNFRMLGGWVFVAFDDLGNRREDESRSAGKISVSSCQTRSMTISVARMDVAIKPPARALLILELFAGIADQNGIKTRIGRTKAGLAGCLLKCRVHQLAIEPQLLAGLDLAVSLPGGVERQSASGSGGDRRANTGSRARFSWFITSHRPSSRPFSDLA